MLIYEKKVNGVKHLFGIDANVPADTDAQLVYKDATGATITDMAFTQSFVDGGNGSIKRVSDNKAVNVFIGDATSAIIPKGWVAPASAKAEKKKTVKAKAEETVVEEKEAE